MNTSHMQQYSYLGENLAILGVFFKLNWGGEFGKEKICLILETKQFLNNC